MTRSPDVCLRVGSIAVNVDMCRNRGDGAPTPSSPPTPGAIVVTRPYAPTCPTNYWGSPSPFVALKEAIDVKHTRPNVPIALVAAAAMVLSACNDTHATLSY